MDIRGIVCTCMQFNNDRIWRVLVLAAAVYFLVRGPWRAIHDSGDFLTVFLAARCWIHGMNPYAPADLVVSARAAGSQISEAYFLVTPSVYFPPALLLLSPLAALPWTVAKAIWLFLLTRRLIVGCGCACANGESILARGLGLCSRIRTASYWHQ